ncbi:MAG: hypothetical protein P1P64_01090 [Treponemataceae bacterium]
MFDYNAFYEKYEIADACQKKKLVDELMVVLYFNYKVFFKSDRDTASDFFSVFFEKLDELIKAYDKKRGRFFYYLYIVVKTEFYKFKKARDEKKAYMKTVENTAKLNQEKVFNPLSYAYSFDDTKNSFYTGEPNIHYESESVKKLNKIIDRVYSNIRYTIREEKTIEQILIYRYADILGHEKVSKLCDFFGVDKEKVFGNLVYIEDCCQARKKIMETFDNKVSKFYFKMCYNKKRLKYLSSSNYDYSKCLKLSKSYTRSWKLNRKLLAQISPLTNYKIISQVMDLTYGSIGRYMQKFYDASDSVK